MPNVYVTVVIVRKDLIYEGITTNTMLAKKPMVPRQSQKGPDLRRDYDAISLIEFTDFTRSERT